MVEKVENHPLEVNGPTLFRQGEGLPPARPDLEDVPEVDELLDPFPSRGFANPKLRDDIGVGG